VPVRDSQRFPCITPETLYRHAVEDRAFSPSMQMAW
jgi:hypothetical protein